MSATYLDSILAWHRSRADSDERSLDLLIREAVAAPATRGFRGAIAGHGSLAVIAEVKRRSPSKGVLKHDLDPASLARMYQSGGACCVSVLTDSEHFSGSPRDLALARDACSLPVLRKDFTVDVRDVCDARIMGADCVLLIAAALDDAKLRDCLATAHLVGIDALVEIHDEPEMERALSLGADLIGVNQRDLVTFQVDQERALRMASRFPDDVIAVAESGIRGHQDAVALRQAGYDAILVGETLVTAPDPVVMLRSLMVQ